MSLRPAALFPWFTPTSALKFIGPAVGKSLSRLLRPPRPVEDDEKREPVLRDLLFHLPTAVLDRRNIASVAGLKKGDYATVEVEIDEHAAPPKINRRIPYRVAAHDATGTLTVNFFHVKGDYLARQLPVGQKRLVSGTVDFYDGRPSITHPDNIAPIEKAGQVLKLAPLYPLSQGVNHKLLQRISGEALAKVSVLPEWLDAPLVARETFPGFYESLCRLHQPREEADLAATSPPRRRLAYDELLANQLALGLAKRFEQRAASYRITARPEVEKCWRSALPFTFTPGQEFVLSELAADLAAGKRMLRLLQGDVGSGKTILAFGAMALAAANGFQTCLMAPTDLLARQHFATLQPLAEACGLRLALLTGKMRKNEAEKTREAIASGYSQIVVGTHALFQSGTEFRELALIVIDEQHRFGVGDRLKLAGKGRVPHLLQMTATPIPRSLGMTLYGDMDISSLTERPPGRQEIDTRAIPFSRMPEVVDGLARVLEKGEKAYWVCPLIEANTEEAGLDLAAAEERFEELNARFPGKVGLVHGRLKLADREKVMQQFAQGDLQLLVATTVVEVGVNVTTATVMVVEHAERFGLAQLHQLRGRVGRSDQASRCILLYREPIGDTAKARLRTLRETNDGFRIAEEDLRLRGAGDMLGTRQTGLPEFLLVDYAFHLDLIRIAHDDARLMLERDPDLIGPRGTALRLLLGLFDYDSAIATLRSV